MLQVCWNGIRLMMLLSLFRVIIKYCNLLVSSPYGLVIVRVNISTLITLHIDESGRGLAANLFRKVTCPQMMRHYESQSFLAHFIGGFDNILQGRSSDNPECWF
jgi:hypothetical protein